ncbi:MAG: peptidoglycan DD-metalloendopeptidase family protein [Methylococcales bacterium]
MGYSNLSVLLIVVFFLSGCAESPTYDSSRPVILPAPKKTPGVKPLAQAESSVRSEYIVKKGDTLRLISLSTGVGAELLSKWNNLPKAHKVFIGQRIKLFDPAITANQPVQAVAPVNAPVIQNGQPGEMKKADSIPIIQAPNKPAISNPAISTVNAVKPSAVTSKKTSAPLVEETPQVSKDKEKVLKLYWKWPIQGKLLKTFTQSGNKGIDIEGKAGDSVLAAANGKVVYSGNGLIGYGNLLIIKHDEAHLSAYANNASLQVKEGQKVTQGQVIARCGKSASGIPSVHFEIRKNGKSVNPLLYLPTQ